MASRQAVSSLELTAKNSYQPHASTAGRETNKHDRHGGDTYSATHSPTCVSIRKSWDGNCLHLRPQLAVVRKIPACLEPVLIHVFRCELDSGPKPGSGPDHQQLAGAALSRVQTSNPGKWSFPKLSEAS